jgi:hypothetical protein
MFLLAFAALFCPLLFLLGIAIELGPGSFLLAVLFFLMVARFLGVRDVLSLVGLVHLVRSGPKETDDLVATALTLRSEDGKRTIARLEGILEMATVTPGDEVELHGRWRNGVYFVRAGTNLSASGAEIRIRRRSHSWWLLAVVTSVYAVVLYYGMPYLVRLWQSREMFAGMVPR